MVKRKKKYADVLIQIAVSLNFVNELKLFFKFNKSCSLCMFHSGGSSRYLNQKGVKGYGHLVQIFTKG